MGAVPASTIALIMVLGGLGTAQILQPPSAEALEGAPLNLTCDHSSITMKDYIHWYRQFPNRGPQFIVSGFKDTVQASDPEGALLISADRKSSRLALRAAGRGHAAVYYCAVGDTVRQAGAAPHKNPAGEERPSAGEGRRRNRVISRGNEMEIGKETVNQSHHARGVTGLVTE